MEVRAFDWSIGAERRSPEQGGQDAPFRTQYGLSVPGMPPGAGIRLFRGQVFRPDPVSGGVSVDARPDRRLVLRRREQLAHVHRVEPVLGAAEVAADLDVLALGQDGVGL